MLLRGRIAVITGGTRGIGYATVKKFLENGAKVVLFGSREETVAGALASLKAENPEWEVSGAWPNLVDADEVAAESKDGYADGHRRNQQNQGKIWKNRYSDKQRRYFRQHANLELHCREVCKDHAAERQRGHERRSGRRRYHEGAGRRVHSEYKLHG